MTSFHALCRRHQNLLQGVIDLGPHIQIGRPSQRTDRFDDRGRRLTLFDEGGLNGEKGFLLELMQDKATYSCSAVGQLRSTVSKGVKLRVSIMARWDLPTIESQFNTVC